MGSSYNDCGECHSTTGSGGGSGGTSGGSTPILIPGEQGSPGKDGVDGRGVSSIELIDNNDSTYSLKTTYTDGFVQVTNPIPTTAGDKGDKGDKGDSINWRGTFNLSASPPYTTDDVVYYQGSSYIAIKDTPTGVPSSFSTSWKLIAQKGEKGVQGPTGVADSIMAKSNATSQQAVSNGQSVKVKFENNSFNGTHNGNTIWEASDASKFKAVVEGIWSIAANITVSGVLEGAVCVEVIKNNSIILSKQLREVDDTSILDGSDSYPEETIHLDILTFDKAVLNDYYEIRVTNIGNAQSVQIEAGLPLTWCSAGRWTSQNNSGTGPNGGLTVRDFRKNADNINILEIEYDTVNGVVVDSVDLTENFNAVASDKHFVYTKGIPENVWVIDHNMNKFPAVYLVDNNNRWIIGDVKHVSTTRVNIEFSEPIAGAAYLN